jgi:hypothetical protein
LQNGGGVRRLAGRAGRRAPHAGEAAAGNDEVHEVTAVPDDPAGKARRFVEGLSSEERMLVVLNRELYEGSWDEMIADLRARLDGRPYIFKLANRIADDLKRIERLRKFEQDAGVTLSDFVQLD